MPTVSYPNCICCPQSGSGSGSGSITEIVTIICGGDAVEVPEDLELEFSNGTGVAVCLNGLIYDLFYTLTGSEQHWYNPAGPQPSCLCVDQYAHYLDFQIQCLFSTFVSTFTIVSTGGGPTPPPCGYTGPNYHYSAATSGSFTGNGDTFVFTQSLTSSDGGGTVDVTIRKRAA